MNGHVTHPYGSFSVSDNITVRQYDLLDLLKQSFRTLAIENGLTKCKENSSLSTQSKDYIWLQA